MTLFLCLVPSTQNSTSENEKNLPILMTHRWKRVRKSNHHMCIPKLFPSCQPYCFSHLLNIPTFIWFRCFLHTQGPVKVDIILPRGNTTHNNTNPMTWDAYATVQEYYVFCYWIPPYFVQSWRHGSSIVITLLKFYFLLMSRYRKLVWGSLRKKSAHHWRFGRGNGEGWLT